MQYSLLSRFQGTLLGAMVGETLGLASSRQLLPKWASPHIMSQPESTQLYQLMKPYATALIRGGLDLAQCRQPEHLNALPSPVQVIGGTLPVMLFFHEDLGKLQQQVCQAVRLWPVPLETQHGALAVAFAIAQILREQLNSCTLIPQIVNDLPGSASLRQALEQVHHLLKQGAGLDRTQQSLNLQTGITTTDVIIALAFYCFLSTLENFRLTLTRALRTPDPHLTVMLAGALSGAYNSSIGIPLEWWLAPGYQSLPSSLEVATPKTLQLAIHLMAAWSGVYDPTNAPILVSGSQSPVVAAPGIIRPR